MEKLWYCEMVVSGVIVVVRTKLQSLEILRGMTAQRPQTASPPALEAMPAQRVSGRIGRPPAQEVTMQISLRLPKAWVSALRKRALEVSAAEDRTISPQEMIRRLVGQGLGVDG